MKVTKDFLQEMFTKYPNFCADGVNPAERVRNSKADAEKYQLSMLEGSNGVWEDIEEAAKWLNQFPKWNKFNKDQYAYTLKHVFEKDEANGGRYLCNGDFILAGLLAGFDIKEYNIGSGDVYFNIAGLKQNYRYSAVYRKRDKNGIVVFYKKL